MAYSNSNLDTKIATWFKKDNTCASLHMIKLTGKLRGLAGIDLNLDYPISVFAGKNGCGKTTVLALAACAYHNLNTGFKFAARKRSYYTFSDFFIQTSEEVRQTGIVVRYKFLHTLWRSGAIGYGEQILTKRKNGKWYRYENRITRNVIYLGIDRLVPQTEKTIFKNKVKIFQDGKANAWYNDVEKIVGKILGKDYSQFKIKKAGNYNLQLVKEGNVVYSGFNMGAGERALFELFSIIHECSQNARGTLVVIDEIELGLHEVAQKRLMQTLKEMSIVHRLQIICTTHSPAIIDSVPFDGRFYLERQGDTITVTKGISGSFAAGRLSDTNSNELDILVEDYFAATLLNAQFNLDIRKRVGVIPIGSWSAVSRQLAAAYRHPKLKHKTIAVMDGDQSINKGKIIDLMIKELELPTDVDKIKFKDWVKDKLQFLPGTTNPEKWLLDESHSLIDAGISKRYNISVPGLKGFIKQAISQDTHHEFFFLSESLSISEDLLVEDLARLLASNNNKLLEKLVQGVSDQLI